MGKKLSTEEWSEISSKYRTLSTPIRQIAKKYNIAESSIRRKAKLEGWIRQENAHLVEQKYNIDKELTDYNAQTAQLTAQDKIVIRDEVDRQLKMEGLYNSFEEKLVRKADAQLDKFVPTEDDAVNNILRLTSSIKNIKPPAPKAIINNNQTSNTLNLTLDEEKQELMNLLNAYD